MNPKRLAKEVQEKVDAAGALAGSADWVPVMEAEELNELAERVEAIAGGLAGAASRLRRLAKHKKKGGSKAADHTKQ
jgi:predicted regulator of Ras-like GTPase activity (Roadblock/LC7/MglB family)